MFFFVSENQSGWYMSDVEQRRAIRQGLISHPDYAPGNLSLV